MNTKYLLVFLISAVAFGYFFRDLVVLMESGALSAMMEAAAAHPYFRVGFGLFAAVCMIAMPVLFIMSKKEY